MVSDERFSNERMLFREERRSDPSRWSECSDHAMIATSHYLATRAGVRAFEQGGNAIDAAVAASFAIGVCEPAGSGLGGTALMMIHLGREKRSFVLVGACLAPAAATPEAVAKTHRYRGHTAAAVPIYVATMAKAATAYGRLTREQLLAPAIELAAVGYPITNLQHELASRYASSLAGAARDLFLGPDGRPHRPGHLLRQPALASTLHRLARAGFEDFYQGEIASRITADMRDHGGFVRAEDLEEVKWPREDEPLRGTYRGRDVLTLAPPGGGLTLIELLNLYSALHSRGHRIDTIRGTALLARLIQRARLDRRIHTNLIGPDDYDSARMLIQPEYAEKVVEELLSPSSSNNRAEAQKDTVGKTESQIRGPSLSSGTGVCRGGKHGQEPHPGGGETTHISAMDSEGNVVALTQSIERSYGAGVASPELGFLYNGFLRAFKIHAPHHPHYLRPCAVARSNAAPTILLEDGDPWVSIGSTGSERMASGIVETLARLEYNSPFQAVAGPRLHCTPEGKVLLEAGRFPRELLRLLDHEGFDIQALEPYSFKTGGLNLVVRRVGEASDQRESEGPAATVNSAATAKPAATVNHAATCAERDSSSRQDALIRPNGRCGLFEMCGVADPRRDGGAGGPLHTARRHHRR